MSTIKTDNENLVLHAEGAKDVEIQTNGSTKLTVKSDGNVVIAGNTRLPNNGKLYLWNDHDINYLSYNTWQGYSSAAMNISNAAGTGSLVLKTNNTERMKISSDGNVGIGTASPLEKLHVEGVFRSQELYLQSNTSEPKSIRNVNDWQYSSTTSLGAEYIHMKIDRRPDSESQMYSVTFRGHEYGGSRPINANLCFYNYSGQNNVISVGSNGSHTCSAYKSSDGYAVMTLYIPSHYYVAFTLDQFSTTQGLTKLTITNVTTSNSPTGVF